MKALQRLTHLNNHLVSQNAWKKMAIIRPFSTSNNTNKFKAGLYINPHYAKRSKGGEDAACLSDNMLSVADGVGGWAESGIDPAIYSKRLCNIIDELFASGDERYLFSPRELLIDAVRENRETGSCTCVIATLDEKAAVMQTVNLGDSGYMILRQDEST